MADASITNSATRRCPNCEQGDLALIYEASQVPAHSCLLMDTRDDAICYPTGDLRLGFCHLCGFISNMAWDEQLVAYSTSYEETQHFSETFHNFAKQLAATWVESYDIHDKTVVEIGCGKAEFLSLLCTIGDNQGIGIDPSVIPERLPDDVQQRLRLIPEYYSVHHAKLEADVICCRHTLEHIHATRSFLQTIRESIGSKTNTLVLFELPDVTRVLRERAFWDLYYEHCSYFTAGSLARLFRSCGFDVIELERAYADQYLLLAARPSDQSTTPTLKLEHDLQDTIRDVADFVDNCANVQDHWRTRLASLKATGSRVIAWGAGSKCVAFCTTLGISDEISYAIDINPNKQGRYLPGTGHLVAGPAILNEQPPDAVLVMNPIYCDEIRAVLASHNVTAELIPLQ